jgi:hypothetical protein
VRPWRRTRQALPALREFATAHGLPNGPGG